MDRHRRGDRYVNNPNDSHPYRNPRAGAGGGPPPSRPFDEAPINRHRGSFAGNRRPFDGNPPCYPFNDGDGGGEFRPMDGDGDFQPVGFRGGRNFSDSSEFEVPLSGQKRFNPDYEVPVTGQKRQYPFSGRGSSPDRFGGGNFEKRNFDGGNFEKKSLDGGGFVKLFVGSVPKTATEEDIRPAFEEYGNVVEVALIKDKRSGQQQGCCFIKYDTQEEADRAIHGLHNQYTLPGGVGPIQVRYADGERDRLVDFKLFVGSVNKQATVKELEEIFLPYGRVEDIYLMRDEMKQSRGCGFVKYSNRESAMAAINSLNGIYTMRGCQQPLIVRFADPKKPRPGESRGAPSFGDPGFGPRIQSPGIRPPNLGEAMHAPIPQNLWHSMSQHGMVLSSDGMHNFGSQVASRSGDVNQSSAPNFSPSGGPNLPPLKKSNQSPQKLPSSMQPPTFSQPPPSSAARPPGQLQAPPNFANQTSFSQGFPSQPMPGFNGMLPQQQAQVQAQAQAHPQVQAGVSSTTPGLSNNLPPHVLTAMTNQYQMPGQQQRMMQAPVNQSASPSAQMLSQQKQSLQASYQSSQQTFSQLQQQMQLMQPSNPNLTPQQNLQGLQPVWASGIPQTSTPASTPTVKPMTDSLPGASAAPVKCNWTEHTSPDGYKYYYNSTSGESKWEKPEELVLYEQQQKPQEPQQQKQPHTQQQQQPHPQQQPQLQQASSVQQPQSQSMPNQQTQTPQLQFQSHLQTQMQAQGRYPQQMHHPNQPSAYQTTGVAGLQNIQGYGYPQMPVAGGSMNDPARFQQGMPGTQDWMWKNKTGS